MPKKFIPISVSKHRLEITMEIRMPWLQTSSFFATQICVFFLHSNPLLKIENSTKILKNKK